MQFISNPPLTMPPPTQAPSGRIYRATPQNNINTGVQTTILLDTIDPLFTDGIEDVINHRILPGVAGWYLFFASMCWESVVDQMRYGLEVLLHPSATGIGIDHSCASGTGGTAKQEFRKVSDVIYLTAVQGIYMQAHHVDGSNLPDVVGGRYYTFLTVQRVR